MSQQHVRQLIADNRILNLSDDFDEAEAQRLATGIAVKNAFRDYGIKHGIGFCRSIKAADQLRGQQDLLNDVSGLGPEIENFQISSKKSQGQRSDTLKQFRAAERGFITNARCLTEGVDVPAIDCVAFADPKQSTIDIVQAAGRALRKFEDKIPATPRPAATSCCRLSCRMAWTSWNLPRRPRSVTSCGRSRLCPPRTSVSPSSFVSSRTGTSRKERSSRSQATFLSG